MTEFFCAAVMRFLNFVFIFLFVLLVRKLDLLSLVTKVNRCIVVILNDGLMITSEQLLTLYKSLFMVALGFRIIFALLWTTLNNLVGDRAF